MRVLFGDGINGKIPPSGQAIQASYYVTLGEDGNVGANKITQIISSIVVPGVEVISVNNALSATGGANFENLDRLRKRIPLSIRTKYRAVTRQDFIDVTEIFAGVEKAGVEFDCDVDKYVHIFLVPEGGGQASQQLIDDVTAYLNDRKIITTLIDVVSAGVVNVKITANVTALPGYSNAQVKANVEDKLLNDFFAPANQNVKGSVVIGDIYQAIEDADGVDSSIITLILPVPYARNLTTPTNTLNWTRSILAGSTVIAKWLIRFTSNSVFELFKDDTFAGVFNVNTLVSQPEISFTVNGNHAGGDNYEFYTYPYNQSIYLAEPSIPATQLTDLTINVTGGV